MNQDQWSSLAQLLGSIGIGALLLKVIERIFARGDKRADEFTAFRSELRNDIAALKAELRAKDDEIDKLREQYFALLERVTKLTSENHALRAENHQMRNHLTGFLARIQVIFKRTPGLSEDDLPRLPDWVLESTPGPTQTHMEETP